MFPFFPEIVQAQKHGSRKAGIAFIDLHVRHRLNQLMVTDHTLRDFLYRALQWTPAARPSLAKLGDHPLLPRV